LRIYLELSLGVVLFWRLSQAVSLVLVQMGHWPIVPVVINSGRVRVRGARGGSRRERKREIEREKEGGLLVKMWKE